MSIEKNILEEDLLRADMYEFISNLLKVEPTEDFVEMISKLLDVKIAGSTVLKLGKTFKLSIWNSIKKNSKIIQLNIIFKLDIFYQNIFLKK